MFRFAILTLRGLYSFVTREQFFQIISDLGKNPALHDVVEKVETFEFREAGPNATVADFELWQTDLINYRDRLRRNYSEYITSDGELFTYEFDACKYEKELWAEADFPMPHQSDIFPEHYEELEREDAERDYYFNVMDYID